MARNYFSGGNIFDAGMDAFDRSFDRAQTIRDRVHTSRAGRQMAEGDRRGAAATFAQGGMIDQARTLQADQQAEDERAKSQEAAAIQRRTETVLKVAPALKTVQVGQRKAALQRAYPIFHAAGVPTEVFDNLTEDQLTDQAIDMFTGKVAEAYKQFFQNERGIYGVRDSGQVDALQSFPAKPIELDPDKTYIVPEQEAPVATARPETDAVFGALIQQESGGRPGVLGPQTPYGRAEGMTQMLPATAEEMARKVGLPWRPDLMRGDTPNAAKYQERLGRAYFEEGLQKYGGDVRKALMYYHGGPNERLWGPKTQAYADQVLARAGGQNAMQGGAGEDDMAIPQGYRAIQRGRAKQREAPSGYQWKADGSGLEPIPGGPQDKSAKANPAARTERAAKARNIITTVDGALKRIGSVTGPMGEYSGEAGFVGGMMSRVPGTKAYDLARDVETIKANLGFEELQRMRENSPTGGALGQVAVQELVALQATVANLDVGQSPAQLRANLRKVREHYNNWLKAVGERPIPAAGGRPKPEAPQNNGWSIRPVSR